LEFPLIAHGMEFVVEDEESARVKCSKHLRIVQGDQMIAFGLLLIDIQ